MFPSGCSFYLLYRSFNTSTLVRGVGDFPYFIAFDFDDSYSRKSNFSYTALFTVL